MRKRVGKDAGDILQPPDLWAVEPDGRGPGSVVGCDGVGNGAEHPTGPCLYVDVG